MIRTLLFLLLLTGFPLSAAIVTTVDNSSTAGDGQISLLEVLTSVTDGETISFAIPGERPHYIVTLETGYPIVSKNGVPIGGYSRAMANTSRIRIVLDCLHEVVNAVSIPAQTVGGLSLEQAVRFPEYGAPLVVIGAPLTIGSDSFRTADGDIKSTLREICRRVKGGK